MNEQTEPAREAPSTLAAFYENARLGARLFGEESAGSYLVAGRLIRFDRLPVGDLGLLTVGFRITDRPKREVDPALQPVQVRRTFRRQGGHPHLLRGVRLVPPRRGSACRRRLLGLFRAKHRATRHAGVDTGVRACRVPRLGVASASRYQGPASQSHRHRLRPRPGRHRGRGVPGCPHRGRARRGDRRRRLLHPGSDVRRHRPRHPGVQPRMGDTAGQPRQGPSAPPTGKAS